MLVRDKSMEKGKSLEIYFQNFIISFAEYFATTNFHKTFWNFLINKEVIVFSNNGGLVIQKSIVKTISGNCH